MLFDSNTRRLKQNLRSFKRKRIALESFLKDIYIEDGLAYISSNVKDYAGVINEYSVEGYEMLEPAFAAFIEENAQFIPTEYPILLQISGCEFSARQKDVIEKTIADYYGLKMGNAQVELDDNKGNIVLLSVLSIVMGLIVFGLLNILPVVPTALREICVIIFWVFLWSLVDSIVFQRRSMMNSLAEAAQLASMKVVFKPVFQDELVTIDERDKIMEEVFEDDVILPSNEW